MRRLITALLRCYQSIDRALRANGLLFNRWSGCRQWPTCSDFAIRAVEEDGVLRGLTRSVVRIVRCNPISSTQ